MTDRVRLLPIDAQRVLQLAACIGNRFDLRTLAVVDQKPLMETARDLWEAISAELVLPLGDAYRLMTVEVSGPA